MNRRWIILSLFLLSVSTLRMPLALAQDQQQELLGTAQQAFNDGFSDVAVRYLEDFLQEFPESEKLNAAKLLLGQSYFLQGQYDKAMDLFDGLKNQEANRDAVFFWLGETHLKRTQVEQAKEYYQMVIKDFPQSPFVAQAYYSLAWAYFEQKDFAQAKIFFKQFVMNFPTHQFSEDAALKIAECAYNDGHFDEAIKSFQSHLIKYPQSPYTCVVNLDIGESFYYLERFDEALGFYQKALDPACDDQVKYSADMGLLWSYIKLKKFNEAKALIKGVGDFVKTKKLPEDDLSFLQANLFYEEGEYELALTAFADFIIRFPQSPRVLESYLARANIYFLLKRYPEAIADYQHAAQDKSGDLFEKAVFGLGWSEVKLGHLEQAVKHFESVEAHSSNPVTKANALIQIADAHQDSGHLEEAMGAYERLLNAYPDNPMVDYVQYRKAIALLKSDKIDEALTAFGNLRVNFPSSKYLEDIDYYNGVASFKKGDWRAAAATMENFIKSLLRPSEFTPEANYILALSYLNLKQPENALRIFQKILRIYPDAVNVAQNADIGIAKCQFELGQVKEAVKRFKMIVYKYPRTEIERESLFWLAQYYLKNADYPAAIDFYQALLERFPESGQIDQIYYELGQAYEIQGQTDQALERYKKISPKDSHLIAKAKLSIAGILSKEFDPQRAISAYESIIVTNPDFASDAYLRLGQLYRNAQNYEKEVDTYQKALKVKDDKGQINKAQLQFNIADTLELMSRTEESIEQYLKIPQLYPQELDWVVKAYLRVAKIYEEGKDWEGANVVYQKIIQLNTEEAKYAQERLDWIKNNVSVRKSK